MITGRMRDLEYRAKYGVEKMYKKEEKDKKGGPTKMFYRC